MAATAQTPSWAEINSNVAGVEHSLIRDQTVCVGHTSAFDGQLGNTLAYRYRQEADGLRVSYFAYWTEESPWGHESVAWSLLVDSLYSHLLFTLPGIQYALYGPGDIEGVSIRYHVADRSGSSARLIPREGQAEDTNHEPVALGADELHGAEGATWLLTDGWSHQLGARNAAGWAKEQQAEPSEGNYRCFAGEQLVPLTERVAADFRLGTRDDPQRARPAWL